MSVLPLLLTIAAGWTSVASAAGPAVTTPDGSPVEWAAWVQDQGPVAVLLWASWAPGARGVIDDVESLEAAAAARNLGLVVVSVQEEIDEARRVLGGTNVSWLHDRYGSLLKHHRVVSIPALIIITESGDVLARLDPTASALRGWRGE